MKASTAAVLIDVAICSVIGFAICKTKRLVPLVALPFCLVTFKTTED